MLVIVHNTDAGRVNAAKAAWRRLRTPSMTGCPLCAITRGVRGTNPRWQRYLDSLEYPVRSVNRDQFRAEHAPSWWRTIELPAILLEDGAQLERLVTAAEIRRATTVTELIAAVDKALQARATG